MNRRHFPRFALSKPWAGEARIASDVVVDELGDDGVAIVSRQPGRLGEPLTLALSSGQLLLSLRVASSTPMLFAGEILHRIRLSREPLSESAAPVAVISPGAQPETT